MKFQPPRFYSTSTPTYVDRHYYWGREQYFNGARAHVPISGTMVHLKNVPTPLFVYRWHPFLVVLRRPLSSVTSLVFFPLSNNLSAYQIPSQHCLLTMSTHAKSLLPILLHADNLPVYTSPFPTVHPLTKKRIVPFYITFKDFQHGLPP